MRIRRTLTPGVSQAMAADLIGVSVTAINNWINTRRMQPSQDRRPAVRHPCVEINRIKKLLTPRGRLGPSR